MDCQIEQVLPSEPGAESNLQMQPSENDIQGVYFNSLDSLDVNLEDRRGSVCVF